jgi:hypothetical protein
MLACLLESGASGWQVGLATLLNCTPIAHTVFQQLEVDYYVSNQPAQQLDNTQLKAVPVLRMYGVNDNGGCLFLVCWAGRGCPTSHMQKAVCCSETC